MAKKKNNKKLYPVDVLRSTRVTVTRERNRANEWDQDDLENDVTFIGVVPAKCSWATEVVTPFPLEKGKEYYLVYVVYSSGDSFHRESGLVSVVDLFIDKQKAEDCAKKISDHYKLSDNGSKWSSKPVRPKGYKEYMVPYADEAGDSKTVSASWIGYFESLTVVMVEKIIARTGYGDDSTDELIRYNY